MKNLKKLWLTIPLLIGLNSCATRIHGAVDISYVPARVNEKIYENEIRTSVDVHSVTPIGKAGLSFGAESITYMDLISIENMVNGGGLFKPTNQDYLFYTKLKIPVKENLLEFYVQHNCFHPINRNVMYYLDLGRTPRVMKFLEIFLVN